MYGNLAIISAIIKTMRIDLANYIEEAKKSGMSNKQIYEGLLLTGWGEGNPSPFSEPPIKPKLGLTPVQKKIGIFFLVALIGLFGAFVYAKKLAQENYNKVSMAALRAQRQTEEIKQKRFQNPIVVFDSTANNSISLTAGWQTYRNEEYGFEFRYPSNWRIDECSKGFIYFNGLCDSDGPYGGMIQINYNIVIKEANYTNIQISGVQAKKYELETYSEGPGNSSGLKTWLITFSKGNDDFVLDFVEKYPDDFSIYNQILSTFRFLK